MTWADYRPATEALSFGKRLPTAIYVHRDGEPNMPPALQELVTRSAAALRISQEFNLLKFHTTAFKLSFLSYPTFWDEPHPALHRVITVDLVSGRARPQTFSARTNPPILHRKETFLPPDHPRFAEFAELSRQEEAAGLYSEPSTIGFRLNWERLLKAKSLGYHGHQLISQQENSVPLEIARRKSPCIERHRTALTRVDFSKPTKTLIELGLLSRGKSFFDYGCGHGTDVRGLCGLGFEAHGWDPAHQPDHPKVEADIVNLGYVLNVIEDPAERVEVLADAWRYTRQVLLVTTLVAGREVAIAGECLGDGIRTRLNTFQKYFDHHELHDLLENVLQIEPVAVTLGMFLVFRDEAARENHLAHCNRRPHDWQRISRRLGFEPQRRPRRDVFERHGELLENFWKTLLDLGRLPKPDEYPRLDELRRACGSPRQAERLFVERHGQDALDAARDARSEDLLVYLAMGSFDKRRTPWARLPTPLRRDIQAFFGSYQRACKEALYLLRAAGDPGELELAVEDLDFGWFDAEEEHFTIHRSLLDQLPGVLRVYVACGARLYGDPHEADLIKIHLRSKKLTFLYYENFDGERLPSLNTRIKIDFRRLFVTVIEHNRGMDAQLLFFKERFLPKDYPQREAMERFSKRLRKAGITETTVGHGLTKMQLQDIIVAAKR